MNNDLDHVKDVEVNWTGSDIHLAHVGEHSIQCTVTRLIPASTTSTTSQTTTKENNEQQQQQHRYYQHHPELELVTECWEVPFVIHDVNECELPRGHEMTHQCHPPSICVNAVGTYHCQCTQIITDDTIPADTDTNNNNAWNVAMGIVVSSSPDGHGVSSTTISSCAGRNTTEGCCHRDAFADGHCRANFRCPVDPCTAADDTAAASNCDALASCTRDAVPPGYTCHCPPNTIGTGHTCSSTNNSKAAAAVQPKIRADGTPTPQTLRQMANHQICGCQTPILDPCSDVVCSEPHTVCTAVPAATVEETATSTTPTTPTLRPQCTCIEGYVSTETHGCVDPSPPKLALLCNEHGDNTTRLRQGQTYTECLIAIQDDNAEDIMRSLKIEYSHPILHTCLLDVGEYEVRYTVRTPWTTPSSVSIVRKVLVEDVDECALLSLLSSTNNDALNKCEQMMVPQCAVDEGATCRNSAGGGYSCECPRYTTGDGYLRNIAPDHLSNNRGNIKGYRGGTGCVDVGKPILQKHGEDVVWDVPRHVPLIVDAVGDGGGSGGYPLVPSTRNYTAEVGYIVRHHPNALCTNTNTNYNNKSNNKSKHQHQQQQQQQCVTAVDVTYNDTIDLTADIVIGAPIPLTHNNHNHNTHHHHHTYQIPYNVRDKAGNAAETLYRNVVVREVTLEEYHAARSSASSSGGYHTKRGGHRRGRDRSTATTATTTMTQCPPCSVAECAKCPDCSSSASSIMDDCDAVCAARERLASRTSAQQQQSCPSSSLPEAWSHGDWRRHLLELLTVAPSLVGIIASVSCVVILVVLISRLAAALFGRSGAGSSGSADGSDDAAAAAAQTRRMRDSVTYYSPHPTPSRRPTTATATTADAYNVSSHNAAASPFYSPPAPANGNGGGVHVVQQRGGYVDDMMDDIYEGPVSPTVGGGGIRR